MAVTVNTITGRQLADLHSDSYANLVAWTQVELTTFVDQALKRLSRDHRVFVTRDTSTSTTASQQQYTLPARHLDTLRITVAGSALIPTSIHELQMLDDTPEVTSGTPTRWFEDKITLDKYGLYKVPSASSQTIGVTYTFYPAELDSVANTSIGVPGVIADYLELQALADAFGKESDFALPESVQVIRQHTAFVDEVIVNYWS